MHGHGVHPRLLSHLAGENARAAFWLAWPPSRVPGNAQRRLEPPLLEEGGHARSCEPPAPRRAAWRRESGSQRVGRPRPLCLLEALPPLLITRGVIGGVLVRPTAHGELAEARRENVSGAPQVYVAQLQHARPTPRDAAETCLRVEEMREARAVELRLPGTKTNGNEAGAGLGQTNALHGKLPRHGTKVSHSSNSVGNSCHRPLACGATCTCRTSPPRADW